jgi:hypothetical protein
VLGTLASFIAALLFWRKGAASVGGGAPGIEKLTWKLTGAAAIFLVALGAFHFINPLRPLSDYNKVLVIYENRLARNVGGTAVGAYTIQADVFKDAKIDTNSVVIEMFPAETFESLLPGVDNRSFKTQRPIAAGMYKVRVVYRDTGTVKDFLLEVPPNVSR